MIVKSRRLTGGADLDGVADGQVGRSAVRLSTAVWSGPTGASPSSSSKALTERSGPSQLKPKTGAPPVLISSPSGVVA